MAKTTGAKPVLIFPDGTEQEIPRAGPPSIREQIRLIDLAAAVGAEAVVAELMSIGEECLATESRRIVRSGILALTNVRLDHLDQMGRRKDDIAWTLSAAFPEKGTVFLPQEEVCPVFEERAAERRSRLVPVEASQERGGVFVAEEAGPETDGASAALQPLRLEFEPNLRLSVGILNSLGWAQNEALKGMAGARPDFGSLRIWRIRLEVPPRQGYGVSAFAANDPASSAAVLKKIKGLIPLNSRSLLGLLCLREDRGDRTLQWIRAAEEGFFDDFERVAILGPPARAALLRLRRRLGARCGKFYRPAERRPEAAVSGIAAAAALEPVVVGLGNIVGTGERIIRHWEETGVPHVP